MAEEQQAPAQDEPGTPEPTDEEIWEEIPEESEHENIATAPPDPEPEANIVEEAEAEPEPEPEEVEAEGEEEPEEDPQPEHDYEKRYKDLEREFHKRNEESARMKEELNDMRLNALEAQQDGKQNEPEEEDTDYLRLAKPESLYTDEDRETMEEFSELTGTFRKMIQEEMSKASGKEPEANERLEKPENAYNQYTYERFLQNHENSMVDQVGSFYKDLDKDADFQTFVLASPALTNMMTKSADPADHASVMNLYLDTSGKGDQWRPSAKQEAPKPSQAKQARRQAASGLAKNSAPVMERSPENMSDEELWDSVPEPKDD